MQRAVDSVALYRLMLLAQNKTAPEQVRAIAWTKLNDLKTWLNQKVPDPDVSAHFAYAADRIARFNTDPKEIPVAKPIDPPPGQPIGAID